MNAKIMAFASKAKDFYETNKYKAIGTATALFTTASTFVVGASADGEAPGTTSTSTLSSDLVSAMSSVDYSVILTCVVALIPAVFPAVFGLIAVRKGIGFVLGMVRGA